MLGPPGKGASAVRRARHRVTDRSIAVKVLAGARGDTAAWARGWTRLESVRALDLVEYALGRLPEEAARRAEPTSPRRATAARRLAARQYRALGRVAEAEALGAPDEGADDRTLR